MLLLYGKTKNLFTGKWEDRCNGLFDLGVDYAGKRILDLGSNMGIVAYEISKRGPAFIHGIEKSRHHNHVANMIFQGCSVESRFERVNIGKSKFASALEPSYDIVLMLAVYHYLRGSFGLERAAEILETVATRTQVMIVRTPPIFVDEISETLKRSGLLKEKTIFSPNPKVAGPLILFRKSS